MAENVNGGLAFQATLDIDDFIVSTEAMEEHIRNMTATTAEESEAMEESILNFAQNGASYIIGTLVGGGMAALVNSIVQIRGQFQQLEIAFETMLGNQVKAKNLMNQLVDTAAKTPFDLMGVSSSAKQLLAYGTAAEKVNETLVKLGNVASGLSIPLQDIVYLYGTTMVQGRLYANDVRQFMGRGIPLVNELAAMYGKTAEEINEMVSAGKIGFADVEKVINKMTTAGGQFFNLMEKQSASLTGMIANLGDAWDMALNKLGQDNENLFAGAITGATYLVENLDAILRTLKAVAIGYGTVKAAIVANTLVTKGYTGVALIDNAVRAAKVALQQKTTILSGKELAQSSLSVNAHTAEVAALEAKLTVEEKENLVKSLKIGVIQGLLTVQQQEILSTMGLTAVKEGYLVAALELLTVEQREALSKANLSSNSAVYRAALIQEVNAKTQNQAASLNLMRTEVKTAAAAVEAAKAKALSARAAAESARLELWYAKASGDATKIQIAEKKYLNAVEQEGIMRKAALAAQSDFYIKKKALETAATKQGTAANVVDNTTTDTQIVKKSLLSKVTTTLTAKLKALWATMMANPMMTLISVIGLAVAAFSLFGKKNDEATDAMGEFNDTTKKEIELLNILINVLKNTDKGTKVHKDALEKLNKILQEYNKELITESITVDDLQKKYVELTAAINESAASRIKAKHIEKIQQEQTDAQDKAKKDLIKGGENLKKFVGRGGGGFGGGDRSVDIDSIQKMNKVIYDQIETMAMESAEKLKNLTGDAYAEGFSASLNNISKAVKAASEASDDDMDVFQKKLTKYLTAIVESGQKAENKTNDVVASMKKFSEAGGKSPAVAASVNYAKMSLAELDKALKDTQSEIKALGNADAGKLSELQKQLGDVKTTISEKEANLDTEAAINTRIKQLQEERENVKINSKEYVQLSQTIKGLQAKLPDKKGDNKSDNTAQLAEKQLQAELKLEQARIDVMKDGYEKRKAILNIQHKRNLADIDKEERELEKARKEAGKSGLSGAEKDLFQQRRNVENQKYTQEENKLFNGEIEYKKSQYELYFQWLRAMGKETADTRFVDLLKDGKSYKEYLERQISELNAKKGKSNITEGETNFLITVSAQYNEVVGAKSAMDTFKESINRAIERAATLAEKIKIINDEEAKMANGNSSGLVGEDEKAEGALFISEERRELEQELQQRVLNDYRTFEQKQKEIRDEYELLRLEAIRQGNTAVLNEINRGENEALSTLNAQMLMQTDSWKNLFSDLDELSVEEIDKLIQEIQQKMSSADLKLNPADMKAVLDKLDEAKKKILDVNPFKALGKALTSVFQTSRDGSKKSSAEIKRDWNNLAKATEGTFDFVNDAIDNCSVLSNVIGDSGKAIINTLQGIVMAGIAMAAAIKSAEKASVILTIISIALQAIQWIASLFNKDEEIEERIQNIQASIDGLSNAFDRLSNAANRTYWEFSDEEREAHKQRIDSINQQINALEQQRQVALSSWQFSEYARLTQEIKDLQYALEKTQQGGDIFDIYNAQRENLKEQQEMLNQQIAAENEKKKTDYDKIRDWEEKINDINTQLEDMERSMVETLAGTDVKSAIDEFADALVEAYVKGEDAAVALGEVTKNVMKKAVVEAIKRQFLAKAINDAVEYLGESMKDGTLSDKERRDFENMVNAAGAATTAALDAVGDWIKDIGSETVADPLVGALQGLSEETGSVVAGRINAVVINQSEMMALMRQSLIWQAEIATNTRYNRHLEGIYLVLNEMKNNVSLLSQGIGG
ncbi:MAG: tape measure protein [Prevotellaceae bacterium]|jgi:tape measure domain-containing protein|nr:tape measure protein [Prevotellaceae bacterium]